MPYLVLNFRGSIKQFADLKFLDPVSYEGHIGITASIILSLFVLRFYVCFVVIFEEPLSERNKENI